MDSITHVVLGAAIGEVLLGKKLGKKGMFWGALANTIPDFDVFANSFSNPVDALLIHRGITHSLLFAVLMPFPLAALLQKLYGKNGTSFRSWALVFFLGFITHDMLDIMTSYGTALLSPFSQQRLSCNTIFVADPLFTIPLLIAFIALLSVKKDSTKRKNWIRFGFLSSLTYLLLTFMIKTHVTTVTQNSLQQQKLHHSRFFTTPTPFNNLLWLIVAENEKGFYTGYYSLFDKRDIVQYSFIPKNEEITEEIKNEPALKKLQIFSNNYYTIVNQGSSWIFYDLRFGQVGGWYKEDAPFAFQYKLEKGANNQMILEKGRWNTSSSISEDFRQLFVRIKGI